MLAALNQMVLNAHTSSSKRVVGMLRTSELQKQLYLLALAGTILFFSVSMSCFIPSHGVDIRGGCRPGHVRAMPGLYL